MPPGARAPHRERGHRSGGIGSRHGQHPNRKPCHFEDKSDAVFDITEKCGEILDAEMSEDADHSLTPILDSLSYGVANRAGPENSLQGDDHDYFLNSGDLAGIPVIGSDNEDDQNFTPKDTLSSAIPDEDHLEEGKRVPDHELDGEKEIQVQNAIQKDLTSPFEQGSVFKSLRKDFSITRDNGKETFSAKDKNREGHLQDNEKRLEKIPKDMDSRLKSSFLDKAEKLQMSKRKPTPNEEPKKETTSDEESRDETNPGGSPNDGPGDSPKGVKSPGNSFIKTVIGTALGAGLAVAVPPLFISMLGFTGAGIAAGSMAAMMMSAAAIANGGGVAAGSTVAVLQSVGAAGFSVGTKIGLGTLGGASGAWLSKLKKTSK